MVLVHKPGLDDHDFDHLPDRRFPLAPLPELHPRPRGGRGPRRAVEGRGGGAQHVAHPRRGRRPARSSRRPRPRPGCPCDDPVRFGGEALWREIEAAVDALPWVVASDAAPARGRGMTFAHPASGPWSCRSATRSSSPARRTARGGGSRRSSPSCATTPTGPTGRWAWARATRTPYYGDTPETMAAVAPLLLDGAGAARGRRCAAGSDEARAALEAADGADGRRARPPRRRPSAPSTSRSTTSSASASGLPVRELLDMPRRAPADGLHAGDRRARSWSPSGRRRAADFPALKIKVGGPSDIATLEAVRACTRGPIRVDANTGWTLEGAARAAAGAGAPGRGAHRAAVPGPPPRPAARAPGALAAAHRGRRERGDDRGPGRARGRRRRAST